MSWNKLCISVTILAASVLLLACSEKEQTQPLMQESLMTTDEVNYYTVQVKRGDYETVVNGAASIVYLLERELYLEKDNARYDEIFVKTGQQVKEGDILMSFEIEESKAQLESLKLQLQRKKEDTDKDSIEMLENINFHVKQTEELKDEKLQIANLEIDKLQASYEQFLYQAELEMKNLEEAITELEEEQSDNVLRAPFDGVIDSVSTFTKGDKVVPGQVLITMHSTDKLLLETTNTANKLRYNMPVTIEVSNRQNVRTFTGKVVTAPNILPLEISQDIMFIELDEAVTEEDLKGTVKYSATLEKVQDALVVNKEAVNAEDGSNYVYILEDNALKKRFVKVYSSTHSDTVWILDGLSEGQTVIID